MRFLVFALSLFLGVSFAAQCAAAELTPEQRKELTQIRAELRKVSALVRGKKIDEAQSIVTGVEERLSKVQTDAGLEDNDKLLVPIRKQIETANGLIERAENAPGAKAAPKDKKAAPKAQPEMKKADAEMKKADDGGVSFTRDVAPILQQRCMPCHGEQMNGQLRMDTFAGLRQGGQSGGLLVPGNPNNSLIIQRVTSPLPQFRMPRNRDPLNQNEIQALGVWIGQGAKFDGDNESDPIGQKKMATAKTKSSEMRKPTVDIPKPTGKETVSFKRDIAPFMVNICLRCHRGDDPRGGFSVETFEKLMIGGKSGQVVLPTDLAGSRLWNLVGEQKPIKMPPGDLLITRKNHGDLRTWILEGAKFDGDDPLAELRTLVPTASQEETDALAKMTDEQIQKYRLERSREQWKKALPKEEPAVIEGRDVVIIGNIPPARAQQVSAWADGTVDALRSLFAIKTQPAWRGRLAVFVFGDRFGYEEFGHAVEDRQTPREQMGHTVVNPSYSDAYTVMQDIGDQPMSNGLSFRSIVTSQVTSAFLLRAGDKLPQWLVQGTGFALAARSEGANPLARSMKGSIAPLVATVQKPEDVFVEGTFKPGDVPVVGMQLVEFLISHGGEQKFSQFVREVQGGTPVDKSLQNVYRSDPATIGRAFLASVR